eukprot:COSAG02_NODE_19960_length_855_cov_3.863757_1_plen_158_part_10
MSPLSYERDRLQSELAAAERDGDQQWVASLKSQLDEVLRKIHKPPNLSQEVRAKRRAWMQNLCATQTDALTRVSLLTQQRDATFFAGGPIQELEEQIAEAAQQAHRGYGRYFAPTLEDIAIIVTAVQRSRMIKELKLWDECSNCHTKTTYQTFQRYIR